MTDSYMWLCQQGARAKPVRWYFAHSCFYGVLLLCDSPTGQAPKNEEMLARLKKGDTVATNGGVIGSIFAVTPTR